MKGSVAVDCDQFIASASHAEFLHVGELAQAVAGLDALNKVMLEFFGLAVHEIDRGLIDGEDVS